jgi:hypothetical protein
MSKWSFGSNLSGFLNKNQLVNLKPETIRSDGWFEVLVQKISSVAQKLGNFSATAWSLYPAFIGFLTGLRVNNFRMTKRSLLITPNHLGIVDKR